MIFRKIINWFLEKPYRQMITGAILVVVGIGIVYAINKANTGFFERPVGRSRNRFTSGTIAKNGQNIEGTVFLLIMPDAKDFRAVNPKYDQDWVNGVGDTEYEALFKFLEGKNIKSVLDLAGGSGTLTRMLMERGYDVFLFDIADNMIAEARLNGVPEEKSMAGDIFTSNPGKTFDCIIFKSSMHEIPLEKSAQLHSTVYGLLNSGGWFMDWDTHVPTEEDAIWFKKWVNLKDTVAGLDDLVKNRYFYPETLISKSMEKVGFLNVEIVYRFFYTLSVSKMSKMYWADDTEKTQKFFNETRELSKTAPSNIVVNEIAPMDIELKIPAIIIVGQK